MFCTYCGIKNPDYAEFCTNCGRRLEKEIHTPPAGIMLVPGERMSNGQVPAEQVAVARESVPAGRDIAPHATLPTSPPGLPLASTSSPGEHSSVAVLDRVSSPSQQPLKEQPNDPASAFPFQQAQPSERFGPPSDQQSSLSDEAPPTVPLTLASAPHHNVATLPAQTSGNSPPISSPPISSPPKKGLRDKLPKKWRIMALIALIILLVGGSASFLIPWLHTVLPAATATVTITPMSQSMNHSYTIDAVTGMPDASQHQVQARLLSFTTSAQSKTVKATGQGHQDATFATGTLTFSGATGTEDIPAGTTVAGGSGVSVAFLTDASISPGHTITIKAQAVNTGSGGNIGAYDIDGRFYYIQGDPNITVYMQNTQAFTGGQNAHDYTFVQQSDIDDATTALTTQLTSDAQAAVQKQLHSNEQFASTPECVPKTSSNHKADDRVTDFKVTVSVTCTGQAYEPQAVQSMAADWFKSDTASQLGTNYALAGDVLTGSPFAQPGNDQNRVSFLVNEQGVWVYQFSDTQKQNIAQLIAGKPLADTQALLQKQTGVKKATVKTEGFWGSAMPTSPSDIKFIVLSVPGLQATPTS